MEGSEFHLLGDVVVDIPVDSMISFSSAVLSCYLFAHCMTPADPPTIKKTQSSETPVGRMGTLQCDATAVPTPEFEWYRDEKR